MNKKDPEFLAHLERVQQRADRLIVELDAERKTAPHILMDAYVAHLLVAVALARSAGSSREEALQMFGTVWDGSIVHFVAKDAET